jgi:hypothetical protein
MRREEAHDVIHRLAHHGLAALEHEEPRQIVITI